MDYIKDMTIKFVNMFEEITGRTFDLEDDFAKTCFCFYAISFGLGCIKYVSEHSDVFSKILSEVLYENK